MSVMISIGLIKQAAIFSHDRRATRKGVAVGVSS